MSLLGDAPLGDLPLGDFNSDYSLSTPDVLDSLLDKLPYKERTWLMRAYPRDASTSTNPITTIEVNMSTDGHKNRPTDDEHIQYPQALIEPYSLRYELPSIIRGDLWGQASTSIGQVVIGDPRAIYRYLAAEDWVDRQVDIYLGPKRGRQREFSRVARLLSRPMSYSLDRLTIPVDDYTRLFDVPIQGTRYAGTGGLEGGAEIAGKVKPILLGIRRQIQPVLVDGTNAIYQIHDGSMEAVLAVRDKGVAVTFNANVADITASVPPINTYNTSLATGYIRLGSTPNGIVTVDAKGHNSSAYGYQETIAGLIKILAVEFAGLVEAGELDGVAFSSLSTHTAVMGAYINDQSTILDVMNVDLHVSAGSYGWLRPDKVLTVGRITDPSLASSDFDISQSSGDIRNTDLRMDPFEVTVGRVIVKYRPYSRTMSETDLDSSISLANRKDYGEEYRSVEASDATTIQQVAGYKELTIITSLDQEADAQALADEQLALRKTARELGTISPRVGLIKRGIGSIVQVTSDRLATSPKNYAIVGVENRSEGPGDSDHIVWTLFG